MLTIAKSAAADATEACFRVASSRNQRLEELGILALAEAYARAGLCVEQVEIPNGRANQMLELGRIDALDLRTEAYFQSDKLGLKVEPALLTSRAVVVTRREDAWTINDPSDLWGLEIGLLADVLWARNLVRRHGGRAVEFPPQSQILALLQAGRIDGFLISSLQLRTLLRGGRLDPAGFRVSDPLLDLSAFHVLAPRHQAVRPALSEAIQSIQSDGTLLRLMGQVLWRE